MNSCRVCLSFVSNVSDISEKSHNGRNLLSVFIEFINIFVERPCYLCPMCERGLRFTYDFRKKAVKSTTFFETEIKIELPDEDISVKESTIDFVKNVEKENHSTINGNVTNEKEPKTYEGRCRYCFETFSQRNKLKFHETNHVSHNKGLECHFCGKHFGRHDLIKHIKLVHLRDSTQRYYCDKCHKNFSAVSTLSTHKKLIHTSKVQNTFNCYHCEKTFADKHFLRCHIRNVHNSIVAKCHYCEKEFKCKASLKTHILGVHIKRQEFVCKICHKQFPTAARRINHMRSHTLNPSFHCVDCDLSFKTNSNLQRHKSNVHSNVFRYECSTCSQKFKTSTGLKLHKSKHNPPEFQCHVCDKMFTRNNGLKEHINAIHLNRKLNCTLCKQEFSRKDALLKHRKVFHFNET